MLLGLILMDAVSGLILVDAVSVLILLIHEVAPRAVRMAARILMAVCTASRMSFFLFIICCGCWC